MKKFSKNLNVILGLSLFMGVVLTLIAPALIGVLFKPVVSFGTNCEPAATYSMSKLVWTQFIGLAFGALAGLVWVATRKTSDPVVTPVDKSTT